MWLDTLSRMTVVFYDYIGQNYIFAYSNWKTSELEKIKIWKKPWKIVFFCGRAVALRGGYFDKFLWAYFLSKLGNVGIFLSVRGCFNSKKKSSGGVGKIVGKALKPPENPKIQWFLI